MFFYFDSLSLVLSAFRDSVFSIAESNPVTGRSSLFLRAVNMFRQGGARSSPNRRFIIYLSPWHVDAFWIFITDYGANWWAPFVLMHMSAFKLQENKNCSYQYFSFSHFMILTVILSQKDRQSNEKCFLLFSLMIKFVNFVNNIRFL